MKIIPYSTNKYIKGGNLSEEERTKYMELCNKFINYDENTDYASITEEMLKILKAETEKHIDNLQKDKYSGVIYDENKKEKMKKELEEIFSNIDANETNYIGKINIVSLQVVLLFTIHCITEEYKWTVRNNEYNEYLLLTNVEWKKYEKIKECITNYENRLTVKDISMLYLNKSMYKTDYAPYSTSPKNYKEVYFIVAVGELTLDEIIESILNNFYLCGINPSIAITDSFKLTPFEFMRHDMVHGNNYRLMCLSKNDMNTDLVKKFYGWCKVNNVEMYEIQFVLFILIHEFGCCCTPDKEYINEQYLKEEIISNKTYFYKLTSLNNLLGLIPNYILDENWSDYEKIINEIVYNESSVTNKLIKLDEKLDEIRTQLNDESISDEDYDKIHNLGMVIYKTIDKINSKLKPKIVDYVSKCIKKYVETVKEWKNAQSKNVGGKKITKKNKKKINNLKRNLRKITHKIVNKSIRKRKYNKYKKSCKTTKNVK